MELSAMSAEALPTSVALLGLMSGMWLAQAISVAAKFGVAVCDKAATFRGQCQDTGSAVSVS